MSAKIQSPEAITFRPAVAEDQIVLSEILSDAKGIKEQNGDDAWGLRNFTPQEVEGLIEQGGVFIGEVGGLAVATVTLLEDDERIWGAKGLDGEALYVHKLARRSDRPGAGREAMRFAEQRARALGRRALRLDNPSVLDAYYESLGFREVESRDMGVYKPTLREKRLD